MELFIVGMGLVTVSLVVYQFKLYFASLRANPGLQGKL